MKLLELLGSFEANCLMGSSNSPILLELTIISYISSSSISLIFFIKVWENFLLLYYEVRISDLLPILTGILTFWCDIIKNVINLNYSIGVILVLQQGHSIRISLHFRRQLVWKTWLQEVIIRKSLDFLLCTFWRYLFCKSHSVHYSYKSLRHIGQFFSYSFYVSISKAFSSIEIPS